MYIFVSIAALWLPFPSGSSSSEANIGHVFSSFLWGRNYWPEDSWCVQRERTLLCMWYQVMGACRFFYCSGSEQSNHLKCVEWEIWAVVHVYCVYIGIIQNMSRQIHMHACVHAVCYLYERKHLSFREATERMKNELLCVMSFVLWTASQMGCLHCCETLPQSILPQGRNLFPTKGLVGNETKSRKSTRKVHILFCSFTQ